MKIAIDGRQLANEGSGFTTYTKSLISALARIDHKNEYFIYLDQALERPYIERGCNVKDVIVPANFGGFFWKQCSVPFEAIQKNRNIDLFHFLCNSPSYTCPGNLVYTIHDLIFWLHPGSIPLGHYLSLRLQMPIGAKRAKKIITVSLSAKKDICRFLHVDPQKVEVIYEGVDEDLAIVTDMAKRELVRERYQLPNSFILYLGSFLPHKNIPFLLKAFADLPAILRKKFPLVLAGNPGKNLDSVNGHIVSLNIQRDVIVTGYVQNSDLATLYSMADLFVFPSLYEGFGLPPLEAMACCTPVISSSSSSLPEVVGNAGKLLRPDDITNWTVAMENVLTDPELRSQMTEAGLTQVQKFSWRETAKRTLMVYERAMST